MNKKILEEILMDDKVESNIRNNIDVLLKIIPEVKIMIGFEHKHPHHHLDVWEHTLYALSLSKKDFEIRLVLLLHDIGKPMCFIEGDKRHFNGHPEISSLIARPILERLKFDNDFIEEVCYLIKMHDTPIKKEDICKNLDLTLKRYEIQECDALAHHPDKLEKRIKYLKKTKQLIDEEVNFNG